MEARESMRIMEEMIEKSRKQYAGESILYLVWGWLVLVAALAHFAMLHFNWVHPAKAWIVWPVLMGIGAITTMVIIIRSNRERRVKTHIDRSMQSLWTAFFVGLLIVLGFMPQLGWENTYPVILVLYGMGSFASGGILNFRPLQWGGAACFLLAIAAFFLAFNWQLLLIALAILLGYLLPGYLLQSKTKEYATA